MCPEKVITWWKYNCNKQDGRGWGIFELSQQNFTVDGKP